MPKAGEFLLDTNAAIGLMQADPTFISQFKGATLFLPSVAVGELYFGAFKSSRVDRNILRIVELVSDFTVIDCDLATTPVYGLIKQQLRSKGKPIPDNDVWIAAVAIQHGLVLATRDTHFDSVPNLVVQAW